MPLSNNATILRLSFSKMRFCVYITARRSALADGVLGDDWRRSHGSLLDLRAFRLLQLVLGLIALCPAMSD